MLHLRTPSAGAEHGWHVVLAVLSAALGCSLLPNWMRSGYRKGWPNWSSMIPSGRSGCAGASVLESAVCALAFREARPQEYSLRVARISQIMPMTNLARCLILRLADAICTQRVR